VRRARTLGRHTNRIAGGLLALAGVYIVAFWVIELAGITGGAVSAAVPLVERGSSLVADGVPKVGGHSVPPPALWNARLSPREWAAGHGVAGRSASAYRVLQPPDRVTLGRQRRLGSVVGARQPDSGFRF
jgi:hypothetical protein